MDDRYSGENFPKMFDAAKLGELVASKRKNQFTWQIYGKYVRKKLSEDK